jgi:hypothetical protein
MKESYQALWWLPAGRLPTIPDAQRRIAHLRAHGPTRYAFTFRAPFPAPDQPTAPDQGAGEDWYCPA